MADIFGPITNPLSQGYGDFDAPDGGIVKFLNNILKTLTVVAGVWFLLNVIMAALDFIQNSGDPDKISKAWSKIWNSLVGLVIIIISFAVAAVLGWILFKDPRAILQPKIYGPGI